MLQKFSYSLDVSKDGYKILKVCTGEKTIYTSSKYNTKREIDKLISQIDEEKDIESFFIFGLSNGEYLEDLLKCNYKGKIVIVDYFEDLVKKYREIYCNGKNNLNIILFDDVKSYVVKNQKIKCISYGNSKEIFENQILKASKEIKEVILDRRINDNTINFFSQYWIENILESIPHILDSDFINSYKDVYKDKPAIIVSAGPSLENDLPYLKGFEDNFVIISGGRTLPTLKRSNIKVDFTCIVDGGETSYDVIKEGLDYQTKLVVSGIVNKKIINEFKGEKIYFSESNYGVFIKNLFGYAPDLIFAGGSVAHASVDFARYLGCNPIIMIGQDLAYTNNKTHADIASIKSNNFIDTSNLMVENVYGKSIPTSPSLDSFRKKFEYYIEKINKVLPDIKFINSSDGGANIKGAEFIKFKDIIETYTDKIYKNVEVQTRDKFDVKFLYDNLTKVLVESKKVINLCNRAIRLNNELETVYNKNISRTNYILKELDKIDNKIKNKKNVLGIVWSLLHEVSEFVIRYHNKKCIANQKTELESTVELGILINTSIKSSIENMIPILEDTLSKIDVKLQNGIKVNDK